MWAEVDVEVEVEVRTRRVEVVDSSSSSEEAARRIRRCLTIFPAWSADVMTGAAVGAAATGARPENAKEEGETEGEGKATGTNSRRANRLRVTIVEAVAPSPVEVVEGDWAAEEAEL